MDTDEKKDDYRRKYDEAQKEVDRLQEELERYKDFEMENKELKKEVKVLKKKLALLEQEKKFKTPSPFFKPTNRKKKNRRKVGAPKGHKGTSREIPRPEEITDWITLTTDTCPHCEHHVEPSEITEVRYVWDIPPPQPIITEITTVKSWCPICTKMVAPKNPDAFPSKKFGITLMAMVSFKRMQGVPREKILIFLEEFYGIKLTTATLKDMEEFVASTLRDEYDKIKEEIRKAMVVNGDETSWPLDGKNHWLWVISTKIAALFVVHRSRGKTVPNEILNEDFEGVLVNDGWNGYNSVDRPKQQCLIHVNRQLQRIEVMYRIEPRGFLKAQKPVYKRRGRPKKEFGKFERNLRTLMRGAVKFVETGPGLETRKRAVEKFEKRLDRLINKSYKDVWVLKKVKFLKRHFDEIFTFVKVPDVPWHNNQAERDLRPSVVIRKTSYGNRSLMGAKAFETMMSLFMTCKKKGLNFFNLNALSTPIMIRIHFDVMLTVIADTLYRLMAKDLRGFEECTAKQMFGRFINAPGKIYVDGKKLTVQFRKRTHTPVLRSNKLLGRPCKVPWLGNKTLRYKWTP